MNVTTNDIYKMKQGYNTMRKNGGRWINIMKERGREKRKRGT